MKFDFMRSENIVIVKFPVLYHANLRKVTGIPVVVFVLYQ